MLSTDDPSFDPPRISARRSLSVLILSVSALLVLNVGLRALIADLNWSARNGNTVLFKFWLPLCRNLCANVGDGQGYVLFQATRDGNRELVALLLKYGADPDAINRLDQHDYTQTLEAQTALHIAIDENQTESFMELLAAGADPNLATEESKITPLRLALHEGELGMADYLISHGAKVDAKGPGGKTPLHEFSSYNKYADFNQQNILKFLLDHSADPIALDEDRNTPFHVALNHGNHDALQILYTSGVKVPLKNGKTLLEMAEDWHRFLLVEHIRNNKLDALDAHKYEDAAVVDEVPPIDEEIPPEYLDFDQQPPFYQAQAIAECIKVIKAL